MQQFTLGLRYTNGYPILVSRICELIDKKVSVQFGDASKAWTNNGIDEAVKLILAENNTLFQSLTKNLNNYPDLKSSIRSILMEGTKLSWNPDQDDIVQISYLLAEKFTNRFSQFLVANFSANQYAREHNII